MTSSISSAAAVECVRAFSRFYTRQLGLLNQGLLGSEFTLTEARVLYELFHRADVTASSIAAELGIDMGYLSRVLKKFERRGYIERVRSAEDARERLLRMTKQGALALRPLELASRRQVAAMLDPLHEGGRDALVSAMQQVRALLHDESLRAAPITLRALQIGDVGWITRRQGMLYAEEYGFDQTYEALVAEILAAFVTAYDPMSAQAWVAERHGEIVGSVFLVRVDAQLAKLRLLYVEPSARGSGLGLRLVRECIAAARAKNYRKLTLWTNDVLVSARRLYEACGFQLTDQAAHHSFGRDLLGQTWHLDL